MCFNDLLSSTLANRQDYGIVPKGTEKAHQQAPALPLSLIELKSCEQYDEIYTTTLYFSAKLDH